MSTQDNRLTTNISSRFSSNSAANAAELLENPEEMFHRYWTYTINNEHITVWRCCDTGNTIYCNWRYEPAMHITIQSGMHILLNRDDCNITIYEYNMNIIWI